jgi:hypothetical protein
VLYKCSISISLITVLALRFDWRFNLLKPCPIFWNHVPWPNINCFPQFDLCSHFDWRFILCFWQFPYKLCYQSTRLSKICSTDRLKVHAPWHNINCFPQIYLCSHFDWRFILCSWQFPYKLCYQTTRSSEIYSIDRLSSTRNSIYSNETGFSFRTSRFFSQFNAETINYYPNKGTSIVRVQILFQIP